MNSKQNRREFLKNSAKGTLGLITLSAIPLTLTACSDGENINTSAMANLGPLEDLKKGPFPKKVDYVVTIEDGWVTQERSGFVFIQMEENNNEMMIMSPICTHLGCTASFAKEDQKKEGITFFCPCHGGEYDEFGNNIGGPPPRPLDVFQPYIKDGEVYIPVLSPTERT
ncbi:ubiquinol-cytochrome c reductase iron-sulfur subunit [Chengkuizengella axinellae]|uniref:Ubiquinol-cytochrome c reductase iron-sulfur subunit n=1 Tax=Chengkuizengella axinellae TaxID=3064388 RepID=A0ABT9J613_9BACL|nr:ubiquinol-cytochrome c reductase iron-sulfur subunit [Chengkuizengella sp. 2205SS18-9]MDP5277051.1 ubiquinol-cytochrome c reductase iron-sulfur subunit [Chengkuizengella sp. 2205SS18-9]